MNRRHPAAAARLDDAVRLDEAALLEASARRWLNAYPRRWRVTFGDNLVGTVLDTAERGATRVPLREGLAIMRSGWALRWRERPPFGVWLRWKAFEKLPAKAPQYRAWAIDAILSPWFIVTRQALFAAAWIPGLVLNMLTMLKPGSTGLNPTLLYMFGAMLLLTCLLALSPRLRRGVARGVWRNSFPGEPIPQELLEPHARVVTTP